jgi:hypothetical protein
VRSEYRKKQEAKERAAKSLQQTKKRLGVGPARPLRGAKPSPLATRTWERRPKLAPTSDRIPGSTPSDDFMHAPQWKRGASETQATVREIRRKASKDCSCIQQGRSAISGRRLARSDADVAWLVETPRDRSGPTAKTEAASPKPKRSGASCESRANLDG